LALVWEDLDLEFKRYEFWKLKWISGKMEKAFLQTGLISLHYWANGWVLSLGGWWPGVNARPTKAHAMLTRLLKGAAQRWPTPAHTTSTQALEEEIERHPVLSG
jgi:hypothetical protein